jgi:hypothetical protein
MASGVSSLNGNQTFRLDARAVFCLCLMALATPAHAQVNIKPALETWRPKEGLYASPGKDFGDVCGEYGDIIIGLTENLVSGHEWDCKVTKRTDIGPDAMKLNMTCSDYNLAETLFPLDPKKDAKKFKEILELRRINSNSMSVRKTLNGKFTGANGQVNYCPENWQRSYIESRARTKKEAEQIANKAK